MLVHLVRKFTACIVVLYPEILGKELVYRCLSLQSGAWQRTVFAELDLLSESMSHALVGKDCGEM